MKRSLLSITVVAAALLSSCAHAGTSYERQQFDRYGRPIGSEIDQCAQGVALTEHCAWVKYGQRVETARTAYQPSAAELDRVARVKAYNKDLAEATKIIEKDVSKQFIEVRTLADNMSDRQEAWAMEKKARQAAIDARNYRVGATKEFLKAKYELQ